jgi:hypothetical protein
MCEHTKPEKQGTNDQKQDGQLNDIPVCITGQEKKEETAEQNAETNAHESTKPMLEGSMRYKLTAGLTGRLAQMMPAEALLTRRANGSRHRTAWCFASAFGHDLAPSEGP